MSATANATAASAAAASAAARASSCAPQSAVSTPARTSSTIAADARGAQRAAPYASATARGSATCSTRRSLSPPSPSAFPPSARFHGVGKSANDPASSTPTARLETNSRRNTDAMDSRDSSFSFSRVARRRATSACACAARMRPPDAARVLSAEKASGESRRSRLSIVASRACMRATDADESPSCSPSSPSGPKPLTTTSGTPPTPF